MQKKLLKKLIILTVCVGLLLTGIPSYSVAAESDFFTESDYTSEENIDLSKDLNALYAGNAGEDYVSNRVFAVCESFEEAERIAEDYTNVTGRKYSLIDYDCDVATYEIGDEVDSLDEDNLETDVLEADDDVKELFEEIAEESDEVIAAVSIAAEEAFELVPLYPDFIYELSSVERPDTSTEDFTDPLTKSKDSDGENTVKYQYYHEMIGDKFVWEEMDKLSLANADPNDDIEYDGPLNGDFVNNLNDEVVAVIDSGINYNHEDFIDADGNSVIITGYNCLAGDEEDKTDCTDNQGHGTNVSGIIANTANGTGGRGVACGVKIMPIKVTNQSSFNVSNAVKGLNKAVEAKTQDNVNICAINLSLGGYLYSSGFNLAVQNAVSAGITVVAAACNNSRSDYAYPACFDNVIGVSSVNSYYIKSYFSNYNEKISISAPGGESYGLVEELGIICDGEYIYASGKDGSNSYAGYKGTSQATPVVTSVVALLYAQNPEISPYEVKSVIENTSKPVHSSYQIGKGCIDAAAALGISENAPAPVLDRESGRIPNECDIHISLSDGSDISEYNGSIYYTLDGSDPDIRNGSTSTKTIDINNPIITLSYDELKDNKTEVVKLMSMLYGTKSEIVSYQYNHSDIDAVLISRRDGIPLNVTGNDPDIIESTEVTVDGSFKLKATDPATGEEIAVNWVSESPLTVSVDNNGTVKANFDSAEPVKITAVPALENVNEASLYVKVTPKTKRVEILPLTEEGNERLYNNNTILLFIDNDNPEIARSYDLSNNEERDRWKIYPETAMQKVIYSSSNNKVAAVSQDGIVTPVSSGSAVIKVMAADGSKVYDSVNVKCEVGISDLSISDASGKGYICAGGKMKFAAEYNNGKTSTSDKKLVWDFSEESIQKGIEFYASIDHKTGTVKAKSNDTVYYHIDFAEVEAKSEKYGISAKYGFSIYPKVEKLTLNSEYKSKKCCYNTKDNRFYFKSYTEIDLDKLISAYPYATAGKYSFSSSNRDVAYVIENAEGLGNSGIGTLHLGKAGTATVSVKSQDGSKKSISIPITVMDTVKISGGSSSIYAGNKLKFSLLSDSGKTLSKGKLKWYVSGSTFSLKNSSTGDIREVCFADFININKSTGEISVNKSDTAEINYLVSNFAFNDELRSNYYNSVVISAVYSPNESYLLPDENPYDSEDLHKFDPNNGLAYIASKTVQILPTLTESVKVRDLPKEDGGTDISSVTLNFVGETKRIYPYSLPETVGAKKRPLDALYGFDFTSTDKSVVTVDENGVICAVKKGKAYVDILAKDGSNKKARVKVTVNYPLVKSVSPSVKTVYLRTELGEQMSDPEDCKYKASADFTVSLKASVGAQKDVEVISQNEKIALVSLKEGCDPQNPEYTILPVGAGKTKIKISALDGSKKKAYVTVNVVAPNCNPVIEIKNGKDMYAASQKVYLKSNSKVKYYFYGIGETLEEKQQSINEMKKYAKLSESSGTVSIKKASAIGCDERTIYVYAKAKDTWQAASNPVAIHIKSAIYINELKVKTENNMYDIASGYSVKMKASCNADATDKRIKWHIYDEDLNNSGYATISSTGKVKVKKKIDSVRNVYVVAEALGGERDALGNSLAKKSNPVKLTIHPAITSLSVKSYPNSGISTVNVGEYLDLKVDVNRGLSESEYNDFSVTYENKGYAKVCLAKNPDTNRYDGSYVRVYGLKKGKTKITFKSCDGSKKQIKFTVQTQ